MWLAWGAVIGSAAQFLVQLPIGDRAAARAAAVARVPRSATCEQTLRAFVPVVLGRGSVQSRGYIDQVHRELPRRGHRRGDGRTRRPCTCCRSACSAWRSRRPSSPRCRARPATRRARAASPEAAARARCAASCSSSCRSAVAFVAIGGSIVALLFQTGRFGARRHDGRVDHPRRLARSGCRRARRAACSARRSTRSSEPRRRCTPRSSASRSPASLGFALALPLRHAFGYSEAWGAFGLTASAGFAAWIEFLLLDRWLGTRIGKVPIPASSGSARSRSRRSRAPPGYGVAHLVGQRSSAARRDRRVRRRLPRRDGRREGTRGCVAARAIRPPPRIGTRRRAATRPS